MDFIKKHPDLVAFTGLFVVFYFVFFCGIGSYPLMDIDETRYASMAHDMFRSKDFMTLYLNGEFFFEKPPLYFWLECLSFALFGKVTEFTVRFPISFLASLSCFLIYFVGKKIVSRTYGVISALILATSAEFLILGKFAILDAVLAACIAFSVYFGFMTYFCQDRNKKYFWWLFYIFSAAAVLAKGIPGFVIPFGTMFFTSIAAGKFKELFKPVFILPGTFLFLLIVLPWHLIMLDTHNPLFFNEYIMKHHVARFTTSAELGRKQPFYFFALTLLWGLFPWVVFALASCGSWLKNTFVRIKNGIDFNDFNNSEKFIFLNSVSALFTFLFFSVSSTKLVTYILPIYPMLACLCAFIVIDFFSGKNEKPVTIISLILTSIAGVAGFIAAFAKLFLPELLYSDIAPAQAFCVILFVVFGISAGVFAVKKMKMQLFVSYIAFMLFLSAFGMGMFFKIDYKFGQDDLMKYAKSALNQGKTLASFGFGRRFSLNYYYTKHVNYETAFDYEHFKQLLADKNTLIIIKNKDSDTILKEVPFTAIEKGRKYTLIQGES